MYYAIHGKMPLNNLYETEAAAQAGIEQMKNCRIPRTRSTAAPS